MVPWSTNKLAIKALGIFMPLACASVLEESIRFQPSVGQSRYGFPTCNLFDHFYSF